MVLPERGKRRHFSSPPFLPLIEGLGKLRALAPIPPNDPLGVSSGDPFPMVMTEVSMTE